MPPTKLETQILCLTYYPVTYFEVLGRPWRDARRLTVPGVAHAKDGLVDLLGGPAADMAATVQKDFEKADDAGLGS